jgi:hypothetical protein
LGSYVIRWLDQAVRFLFRGNEPRYRVPPKVVDTLAIVLDNNDLDR